MTPESSLPSEKTKEGETIPEEYVLKRIKSHEEMKSFQLGNQFSCRWSTGVGPRIGFVRDYPSGLQSHALEQLSLSLRSKRRLRFESGSMLMSSNLLRNSGTSFGGGDQMDCYPIN